MNSKITLLMLALLPCVAIAGCGSSRLQKHKDEIAAARKDEALTYDGLAFSLHTIKDTFTDTEPVVIDSRITNVTNMTPGSGRVINVYAELQEGFLVYLDVQQLAAKDGIGFSYHSENRDIDLDKHLPEYSHYARLRPGYSIGRPVVFRANNLGLPPGIYRMTAIYDNSRLRECLASPELKIEHLQKLQPESGRNPGLVPLWTGTLRSNVVVFEIVKDKSKPARQE